ncbi:FAD-dependent oxidoreductase [Synechococcus sp. GFB01]|uniref:FAD-dependent oxidoreductase n=1 Tax=Synechococcus sp. GFB01 TaxID=1662190 RepID=UPI000B268341|nr:FAD-dependent oxidoreductase [Synechococcus sp. GFB01]
MTHQRERIVVLGAGLQGTCAALVAAQRNYQVCLVDQAARCLDRASLRNEGKIHLGHVYANDDSFRTADLMLRSALSFAPLLERWIPGGFDWPTLRTTPFTYVVANETLIPLPHLYEHYGRVEARCRELQAADRSLHYLGERLDCLWKEQPLPRWLNPAFASTAVATPEVSIDLIRFRQIVDDALEHDSRIELLYGHNVREVTREAHGFTARGCTTSGEQWTRDAGCIVNALWDGRLEIDAQLGLTPNQPWVYRLKHRVLGRTPKALAGIPSMTFVLGAFGDVVTRPDDDSLYLSWYPCCQTGWSQMLKPPAEWDAALTGTLSAREQASVVDNTLAAFDHVVPGLGETRGASADGGVIFSWGDSNIDDTASKLHQRHQIGISAADGYFSMDTGKFTSAPYFASQLEALLS